MKIAWEKIDNMTSRLKVPKGWIVRTLNNDYFGNSIHQIFVEDVDHNWCLDDR